jgi:hypothetical protein
MSHRYVLNRKAFAATRALAEGADKDPKWDYMHVSPAGVICTDTKSIIKVTLPQQPNKDNLAPQVFTSDVFEKLRPKSDENVTMPEGLEAKSNGKIAVPDFKLAIPGPESQVAYITVTAKSLIKMLRAACEVTDHARQLVRLRICGEGKNQMLRIDAHRDEGAQEFTGVLMGTVYTGQSIPGDKQGTSTNVPETIDEKKLSLPLTEGRKFRAEAGD